MNSCLFSTNLRSVPHSYKFSGDFHSVYQDIQTYLSSPTVELDSKALSQRISALTKEEKFLIRSKLIGVLNSLNPGTWDRGSCKYLKLFEAFHPSGKNSECSCDFALAKDHLESSKIKLMVEYLQLTKRMLFKRFAANSCSVDESLYCISNSFDNAIREVSLNSKTSLIKYKEMFCRAVANLGDLHTHVALPDMEKVGFSTQSFYLPITFKTSRERCIVTAVPTDGSIKVNQGDEIIKYNGVSINKIDEDNRCAIIRTSSLSCNQTQIDQYLLSRTTKKGYVIPQRKVQLIVKSHQNGSVYETNLVWLSVLEKVKMSGMDLNSSSKCIAPFEYGSLLWEQDEENAFDAYLFETKQGKAGYIRIDNFDQETEYFSNSCLPDFSSSIQKFERDSSCLIVDLRNNRGGTYVYALALLANLVKRPTPNIKTRMLLSKETAEESKEAIRKVAYLTSYKTERSLQKAALSIGYPFTFESLGSFISTHKTVIQEFDEGREFTSPLPMDGISSIIPDSKISYSKPIMILVNEETYSSAELMAKILQRNGLAKVFGTQTPGALGFEEPFSNTCPHLGLGFEVHTSTTIALKEDGTRDEIGVIPDFKYELSVKDLQDPEELPEYRQAVISAVETMIQESKKKDSESS